MNNIMSESEYFVLEIFFFQNARCCVYVRICIPMYNVDFSYTILYSWTRGIDRIDHIYNSILSGGGRCTRV